MTGAISAIAAALLLSVNTVSDVRRREILLLFSALSGVAGILWRFVASGDALPFVLAGLIPGGLFLLLARASRGGIGMGDGIVVIALGCWIPPETCFLCVSVSLAVLSVAAMACFAAGRRKKQLPYIPFLLAGYGITIFIL